MEHIWPVSIDEGEYCEWEWNDLNNPKSHLERLIQVHFSARDAGWLVQLWIYDFIIAICSAFKIVWPAGNIVLGNILTTLNILVYQAPSGHARANENIAETKRFN